MTYKARNRVLNNVIIPELPLILCKNLNLQIYKTQIITFCILKYYDKYIKRYFKLYIETVTVDEQLGNFGLKALFC